MKSKAKISVVLGLLGLILLGIIMVRSEPVLDWFTARSLHAESDSSKRIVLMNMTRAYDPKYWDRQYLQESLRADTELERRFIAELIHERFNTNGIRELKDLLTPQLQETPKSNVLAVISSLQNVQQ